MRGDEPASAPRQTDARRRLGESGERFAAGWLEARGYCIVERNWRCPAGELDLIAEHGGELVFVEVKTRHGERMGAPEEAVTRTKRLRLVAAAQEYLAAHGTLERPYRIDVVAVALTPSGRLLAVRHYPRSIGIEESCAHAYRRGLVPSPRGAETYGCRTGQPGGYHYATPANECGSPHRRQARHQ